MQGEDRDINVKTVFKKCKIKIKRVIVFYEIFYEIKLYLLSNSCIDFKLLSCLLFIGTPV